MTGTVSRPRAAAGLALVVLAVVAIGFPLVFSSPVITNYAVYALIFAAVRALRVPGVYHAIAGVLFAAICIA